jgi:hypothetical protein
MTLEMPRPLTHIPGADAEAASLIGAAPPSIERDTPFAAKRLSPRLVRAMEMMPGALAIFLISSLLWGYAVSPAVIATLLLVFDGYWLWKSWTIGYHAIKGVRLIRQTLRTHQRREYERLAIEGADVVPWQFVKHVVIIPNYKETPEKLRSTLRTLAKARGARESIIPVLAMEEAESGSDLKGQELANEFADQFWDLLITSHPYGIPGEVRGKSSNEDWAARRAVEEFVDREGLNIDHLTVTSCDADTQFHRRYFECLTYAFATDTARYRRFWQAPIFFYNNIWQVPGPLRVPNAMAGLIHLGRLSRKRRVAFSQSTYSLSMRMARDVGYWDTDVIPEDWHMFLKCYYRLSGNVDVEPIYLPLGNDGALSKTPRETFVNHYLQVRRWGWGVVDTPFAIEQAATHTEIPLSRRLLRFWYFFDNHISWSTQWFFLTLGGLVPWVYGAITDQLLTPGWFYMDHILGDTFLPGWMTITTFIMTPCLIPYLILIVLDTRLRPRAPLHTTRLYRALSFGWWVAISPITFFTSALPALDAQVRLMLGKRMEYRVTEKV